MTDNELLTDAYSQLSEEANELLRRLNDAERLALMRVLTAPHILEKCDESEMPEALAKEMTAALARTLERASDQLSEETKGLLSRLSDAEKWAVERVLVLTSLRPPN